MPKDAVFTSLTKSEKEFIHEMVDNAMLARNRSVTLYFWENGTISVTVEPLTDDGQETQ